MTPPSVLTLVASIIATGCLPGPEVGALHVPSDARVASCNDDSNDAIDVSYSADLADGVFVRGKCISCHMPGGQGWSQSNLSMASYQLLRNGGRRSGPDIVIPGTPCSSVLVLKIEPSPPFGRRMPYNGPPFLSPADIQLVRDWIAEGARDN